MKKGDEAVQYFKIKMPTVVVKLEIYLIIQDIFVFSRILGNAQLNAHCWSARF